MEEKDIYLKEYSDKYAEILRNSELRPQDIKEDILTEEFFKREDIGINKKERLLKMTEELKNKISNLKK